MTARDSVDLGDLPGALQRLSDGVCGFDIELAMSACNAPVRLAAGARRIATGKTQVRQFLLHMFAAFDSIEYDLAVAWVRREVVVVEVDVRFTWGDRACVQLPATIVLRFSGDLISELQFWTYSAACAAFSGLMARIPPVNGTSRVA